MVSSFLMLATMWRDTDECGDLFVGETPQFGGLGDEGSSEVGTDSGDVSQQVVLGLPDGALADLSPSMSTRRHTR